MAVISSTFFSIFFLSPLTLLLSLRIFLGRKFSCKEEKMVSHTRIYCISFALIYSPRVIIGVETQINFWNYLQQLGYNVISRHYPKSEEKAHAHASSYRERHLISWRNDIQWNVPKISPDFWQDFESAWYFMLVVFGASLSWLWDICFQSKKKFQKNVWNVLPVLHQKGLREQNSGKIQKLSTLEICTKLFTICRQLNFLVLSLTICTKLFTVCRLYHFLLNVFHYFQTECTNLFTVCRLIFSFFNSRMYLFYVSLFHFWASHFSIRLLMYCFGLRVFACFGFCTCSTVCSHALAKCGIYTTADTNWVLWTGSIVIY